MIIIQVLGSIVDRSKTAFSYFIFPGWGRVKRFLLEGKPETLAVPYITYYKPMGDIPYISSEQGGLIIHHGLIMRITIYKLPIPIQEL